GRARIVEALVRFRGAGLLVSHDRALLETLTVRTARLHRGKLTLTGGGYGEAKEIWAAADTRARAVREQAKAEVGRARRALGQARAARAAAERSLGGARFDPKDHDARSMGAKNRRAAAEARLGADVRRLRTVVERASAAVPAAPVEAELGRSVFLGYTPAPRPVVLSLDAPELAAGSTVLARDVHVALRREDRVRLAGANGAGDGPLATRAP